VLDDDVPPTHFTGQRCIQGRAVDRIFSVLELGNDNFVLESGFTLHDS
jgi:hypothetical protein